MKLRLALLSLSLLTLAPAVQGQTGDAWKKLDFLLGQWVGMAGENDTPIGAGQGSFSFEAESKP